MQQQAAFPLTATEVAIHAIIAVADNLIVAF